MLQRALFSSASSTSTIVTPSSSTVTPHSNNSSSSRSGSSSNDQKVELDSERSKVLPPPLLTIPEFQTAIENQLILAPLTRGGNLPFRRLCAGFQSNFTMSEMAFARNLFKGYKPTRRKERALAKKSVHEKYFGFQIATKSSDEAIGAAAVAREEGAAWIDLNCGCPIWEATRRGLGAAMLKRPSALEKLVRLTAQSTPLPMTVKIRIGVSDSKINAHSVVRGLADAGAAAVIVHGRTMEQRYTKPADWAIISEVARENTIPVVGNGDILSWYEAEDRMLSSNSGQPHRLDPETGKRSGVAALMAGRGALIKPWLFKEYAEKRSYHPTAAERVEIYWRLAGYFKDHFGRDDFGKRHAFYFLPWHFEFFCRYRPLPEEPFRELSRQAPLIQNSRLVDDTLIAVGLMSDHLTPEGERTKPLDGTLERLLRSEDGECHLAIAEALWAAATAAEAVAALQVMADTRLSEFERPVAGGAGGVGEGESQAKWPSSSSSDSGGKRGDESSWEVGGAGPRGLSTAAGDETDESSVGSTGTGGDSSSGQQRRPQQHGGRSSDGQGKNKAALSQLDLRVGRIVESAPHPLSPTLHVSVVDLGPSASTGTDTEAGTVAVSGTEAGTVAGTEAGTVAGTEVPPGVGANTGLGVGGAEGSAGSAGQGRDLRVAVTARALVGGGLDLVGQKVVVLVNLKPRKFLSVSSSAMVLFSRSGEGEEGGEGVFSPVMAPAAALEGSAVSFPGMRSAPESSGNKAAKAWERVCKEEALRVDAQGVAYFDPRSKAQRDQDNAAADADAEDNSDADGDNEADNEADTVEADGEKGRGKEGSRQPRFHYPFTCRTRVSGSGGGSGSDSGGADVPLQCTATGPGRIL
jgi:tRNA-dihydrouridine synthase 3